MANEVFFKNQENRVVTLAKSKSVLRRRNWLIPLAWTKWDEGKQAAIRFGNVGISRNLDKSSPNEGIERKVQQEEAEERKQCKEERQGLPSFTLMIENSF